MKPTLFLARWALAAGFILAGTKLNADWNSAVDLKLFDLVVVEGNAHQNPEVSNALADLVAQQLKGREAFSQVTRETDLRDALHVKIEASRFRKGSVAARLKFGRAIGQSSLTVKIDVSSSASPSLRDSFIIMESTLLTAPIAGRTGRENFAWLQRKVAKQIAAELVSKAQ